MLINGVETCGLVPQISCSNLSFDALHKAAQTVPVPTGNIFHSGSKYLVRWKTLLLMLVAYDAFILPVEWVFLQIDRRMSGLLYIGLFIDLMFFFDIFVHLNTARLINGSWVTNRKQLAKRYLKSWLVFDVIASIPFELFFNLHLRWLKIVRIFSLLRVVKFSKMAHNIQANFKLSASVYRVIRFVVMVVFGIHWCACIFGVLNRNSESGESMNLSEGIRNFINSLLWSTSTVIPVGYGHSDVRAVTFGARLFGIAVMTFGVGIFTFAITKGVGLVQQLSDIEQRRFESKMDQIEELLDHLNVPDDLWDEITYFFDYNHKTRTPAICNERALIDDLSRQLRSDVISAVNEFETSDSFVLDCVFAMRIRCFPPNHDLTELMQGHLCVVIEGSLIFNNRIIGPGARFGRLSSPLRQEGCKKGPESRTWCRITVLKRDALIPVLMKHREVQRFLCGKGGLRLRPVVRSPGSEAWMNEIVDYLSFDQCKALSLMVDGLRTRLQHQENLIRGVDCIFAVDIARRPSSQPESPSERAAAFTLDAFSTPSIRASASSVAATSSDLESFRLDGSGIHTSTTCGLLSGHNIIGLAYNDFIANRTMEFRISKATSFQAIITECMSTRGYTWGAYWILAKANCTVNPFEIRSLMEFRLQNPTNERMQALSIEKRDNE